MIQAKKKKKQEKKDKHSLYSCCIRGPTRCNDSRNRKKKKRNIRSEYKIQN